MSDAQAVEGVGAAAGLVGISRTTGQIVGAMLVAISFRFLGHAGSFVIAMSAATAVVALLVSCVRIVSRKTSSL